MKLHLHMPMELTHHYRKALMRYKEFTRQGQPQLAWSQLERAHIIGQAYPYEHTEVHWLMLKFGWRIKSFREVFGQIPRLLVGGVKSFVGIIPVGNTGGSNVSALKPMEIPEDLKRLIDAYK